MKLSIPIHCSNTFTWKGNSGVTDITDMTSLGNPWTKVYDNDTIRGFEVRSKKTGKSILFFLGRPDVYECEITGWNFISECGKFKLLIIND